MSEELIKLAAEAIANAEALLIAAGAGMGVDLGLPDFRGPEGFWRAYPACRSPAGMRLFAATEAVSRQAENLKAASQNSMIPKISALFSILLLIGSAVLPAEDSTTNSAIYWRQFSSARRYPPQVTDAGWHTSHRGRL